MSCEECARLRARVAELEAQLGGAEQSAPSEFIFCRVRTGTGERTVEVRAVVGEGMLLGKPLDNPAKVVIFPLAQIVLEHQAWVQAWIGGRGQPLIWESDGADVVRLLLPKREEQASHGQGFVGDRQEVKAGNQFFGFGKRYAAPNAGTEEAAGAQVDDCGGGRCDGWLSD